MIEELLAVVENAVDRVVSPFFPFVLLTVVLGGAVFWILGGT